MQDCLFGVWIKTLAAVSLYRLLGGGALRACKEDCRWMLTTTLRGVIFYGYACLRVTLGEINFANGIFHVRLRLDSHACARNNKRVGHPHPNELLVWGVMLSLGIIQGMVKLKYLRMFFIIVECKGFGDKVVEVGIGRTGGRRECLRECRRLRLPFQLKLRPDRF